jgi:hypothetical protein
MESDNKINVDIDCESIRASVVEIVRSINEYFYSDCKNQNCIDRDKVLNQLGMILKSGRISVPFFLDIQNIKFSDLQLYVDPRRKKYLLKSKKFKNRLKPLNYFVRAM